MSPERGKSINNEEEIEVKKEKAMRKKEGGERIQKKKGQR